MQWTQTELQILRSLREQNADLNWLDMAKKFNELMEPKRARGHWSLVSKYREITGGAEVRHRASLPKIRYVVFPSKLLIEILTQYSPNKTSRRSQQINEEIPETPTTLPTRKRAAIAAGKSRKRQVAPQGQKRKSTRRQPSYALPNGRERSLAQHQHPPPQHQLSVPPPSYFEGPHLPPLAPIAPYSAQQAYRAYPPISAPQLEFWSAATAGPQLAPMGVQSAHYGPYFGVGGSQLPPMGFQEAPIAAGNGGYEEEEGEDGPRWPIQRWE